MSTTNPHTSALPPGLALYQLAIGHYLSRALALAERLGVADRLSEGPRSVEELAAATDTHAPALRRMLRLLVSVGVFVETQDGRFGHTPMSELLCEHAVGSMKAAVNVFCGTAIQDSWRELEYCVRTGEPAFRKDDPDANPFTEMEEDPAAAATFDKAMAAFTSQTALAVAASYDFTGLGTLMDVGGGNGALLIGILQATPGLRGIVFDQPHVAERARDQVARLDLADRIEVVGGSFFDAVPSTADAIVLKHVIHDWNDEQATEILKVCRAALPDRGKLLLVEGVYPSRVEATLECRGAAANDVNMLVCTGGRQRTEHEFRDLYARSGFELARIVPTPARVAVIEGIPV